MTRQLYRHHSSRIDRRDRKAGAIASFWKDNDGVSPVVFLLTCMVFICGLLLGRSGGWFGDTVVQLLALPLIVLAAMHWSRSQLQGPDKLALGLLVGIAVLGLVQLMPLPISVWGALPARADLLRDLHSVGIQPAWRSISLNPYATERALQWTLPAIAMFLAVRWMSPRQRLMLLSILFGGVFVLLILTVVQNTATQGDALASINEATANSAFASSAVSAPPADRSFAGMFSNRNHFGTFLAMTIPFVIAVGLRIWNDHAKHRGHAWIPLLAMLVLVMLALLIGMFLSGSRAAVALGGLSLIGSMALLRKMHVNRKLIWAIAACAVVGAVGMVRIVSMETLARSDSGLAPGARSHIHATTLQAARHFGLLGSGLGTFVRAYQQIEPEQDLGPKYINRAHSDYHELWLETGVPGAALILAFVAWYVWSSWWVWRDVEKSAAITLIARAASLSILMVLAHSFFDYPLRKTAILVVFGMACAMLAPPYARDPGAAAQHIANI